MSACKQKFTANFHILSLMQLMTLAYGISSGLRPKEINRNQSNR